MTNKKPMTQHKTENLQKEQQIFCLVCQKTFLSPDLVEFVKNLVTKMSNQPDFFQVQAELGYLYQ